MSTDPHHGLTPEDLRTLEQRRHALAQHTEGPALDSSLKTTPYVCFTIIDDRYGVPLENAQEVVTITHMVSLPGVPAHIAGLTRLRGKVLPLVNLRVFLQGEVRGNADNDRALVVSAGEHTFGILCTTMDGLMEVRDEEVRELSANASPTVRACATGLTDKQVVLLHLQRLLDQPGFVVRQGVVHADA